MQFITHRDPVNISGGARAFGAAGDAINNLLSIYAGYKNQQREDKQRALENQFKREELGLRQREAERQDVMNQLRIRQEQIAAANRAGARPDVEGTMEVRTRRIDELATNKTNEPAPLDLGQFTPDAHKADATKTGVPPPTPKPTEPIIGTQTWQTMLPEPKQYVPIAAVRDASGRTIVPETQQEVRYQPELEAEQNRQLLEREIMLGRQVRLTPEERKALQARFPGNALASRETLPEDTYTRLMTPTKPAEPKAPEVKTIAGRDFIYAPDNPKANSYGLVDMGPHKSDAAQQGAITPEEFEALVNGYLAGNVSMAELGQRGVKQRVVAEALKRDPKFTSAKYKARVKLRTDMASSGINTAGGKLQSINQLADHLDALEEASKALKNNDYKAVNFAINKIAELTGNTRVIDYDTASLAVAEEISRLLKGGIASATEGQAWEDRFSKNYSRNQQQAAIDEARKLVRGRLKAMRRTWIGTMGNTEDSLQEFNDYLEEAAHRQFDENKAAAGTDPEGLLVGNETTLGAPAATEANKAGLRRLR